MPSIGHVAVALAAGKPHPGPGPRRVAWTCALAGVACFPDLDVLARRLGAGRGSPWLHRGALHSLAIAAAVAILVGLGARALGRPGRRAALVAFAVAASHGLLDAFTGGGGGVMFLWPWSTARFLAPFHVLPAAPMGLRFASARGLDVVAREVVAFSPLLVYAAWPRRRRAAEPSPAGPP